MELAHTFEISRTIRWKSRTFSKYRARPRGIRARSPKNPVKLVDLHEHTIKTAIHPKKQACFFNEIPVISHFSCYFYPNEGDSTCYLAPSSKSGMRNLSPFPHILKTGTPPPPQGCDTLPLVPPPKQPPLGNFFTK